MTFSTVILLISVFIVGLFAGVTLEYFLDMRLMHDYERENGILRGKVIQQDEELKRYKAGNAPQVIEIRDNRASNPDNLFAPF